jgi:two-component system chemotaxis family response regulator WspR
VAQPAPDYGWRLVASIYGSAQAVVEGTMALGVVLAVCAARTRAPVFSSIGLVVLGLFGARLWDLHMFRRARAAAASNKAAALSESDGGNCDIGSPEGWASRHAAGAFVTAMLWGCIDLCVLVGFDDPLLQMFTLMVQAGWIASACMRAAASPVTVLGTALLALIPTEIGVVLAHGGLVKMIIPIALLQLSALLRTGRSLGAQLVAMIDSEQRVAEANARLTRLSATDGMTGIANRRAFDAALLAEWSRARREASDISLILLDVDHFKLYNDTYGHLDGDDCLRAIALLMTSALLRPADMVARFGGEEFVALLPGTGEQGARHVAERVREQVCQAALAHAETALGCVSVSIGVASIAPVQSDDPQSLIRLADAALYDAKRSGRNQVRCASERLALGPWQGPGGDAGPPRASVSPHADGM